jgi:DNA-binding transcriptional LysR family regulator
MNILYMKYAVEVAKTGSINKAADNLYIAQPNLSRAVKELENSLGITVFKRTPKGMTLTHDGEKFIQYAEHILSEVDEMQALFHKDNKNEITFSLSAPRSCYISHAFANFAKLIPSNVRSEISYEETNALRTVNNLMHGGCRLGIIRYATVYDDKFKEMLDEKGLRYEFINEFRYDLIMSMYSSLAIRERIYKDDLHPLIEIAHADPYVPTLTLSEIRRTELPDNKDRRIFIYERATQFELLHTNPDTYMWVSATPPDVLERYELVTKTCEDNDKVYRDVLIYRNGYRLTDYDNLFISCLRNTLQELQK